MSFVLEAVERQQQEAEQQALRAEQQAQDVAALDATEFSSDGRTTPSGSFTGDDREAWEDSGSEGQQLAWDQDEVLEGYGMLDSSTDFGQGWTLTRCKFLGVSRVVVVCLRVGVGGVVAANLEQVY